ncbi:MAG: hypothetical protein OSB45_15375 [Pseudomonadales bacterium]|nr:hypothetical protein [Pseudomonadales bacterium]
MKFLTRLSGTKRLFVMCLLLVPLQVMSSDEGAKAAEHGGTEAAVKEQSGQAADHGGKPAASKEHAGNEVPAES